MQPTHTNLTSKVKFKNLSIRIGIIFSNLSIFLLVLCISGYLSFIATALIFLVGIIIIILTVGTAFAFIPNFFSIITSGATITSNIAGFLTENFYIFASICIACAINSLVLL